MDDSINIASNKKGLPVYIPAGKDGVGIELEKLFLTVKVIEEHLL